MGQIVGNLPIFYFYPWLMLIKSFVILGIFLFFKFNSKIAAYLAAYLFQIDEDAFILVFLAFINKIFSYQQYFFVISAVLLSLLVTPLIINNKEKIYSTIREN
jgi:predicted Kef-type K+ transport protein